MSRNMSEEKLIAHMQEPQALFQMANSLFANGQLDQAVDFYRACIEKDNNFADAYFQLAETLCQQGKPAEAVAFYRQANTLKDRNLLVKNRAAGNGTLSNSASGNLIGSPTMPKQQSNDRDRLATIEVYIQQAEAYLKQGDTERAIAACQQVLRASPNTASAYKVIGNALQAQGKNQEAMSCYVKAIDLEPKFAKAYANIGGIYAQQQQWQQAIAAYQKAIEIEPNVAGFYNNLGKVAQASGNSALANKCRYQALKLEPSQAKPEDFLNLGNSLLHQGQMQEAIACYQSAIKLDSSFAVAYQNLGEVYAQLGNLNEALNCYRQANQLHLGKRGGESSPTSAVTSVSASPNTVGTINPAIFNVGDTLVSATASQNQQETASAYLDQAQSAIKAQNWQQAIELCQQALRIKPDSDVAYKILGNAMQSTGQVNQAAQCYHQALKLQPNFPEVHANLGSLYAQHEQWQQAISHYQAAIAAKPDFIGAYRNLEKILTNMGRLAEAAECHYRLLRLEQDRTSAADLTNTGNDLWKHGKVELAIAAHQEAIQKDPNFVGAYFNLANILSQQGKLAEANECYRKAIEINILRSGNSVQQPPVSATKQPPITNQSSSPVQTKPTSPVVPNIVPEDRDRDLQRAESCLNNQDYEQAIAICQQVASNSLHTPYAKPSTAKQKAEAWRIMGIASQALGKWEEAVAYYQGALELQPKFVEVYDRLGQVYASQKQWQESVAAYLQAIALDPKIASVHRHLAGAFMQMGQKSDGAESWFQAFQLEPDWATAEEHLNLGNMLLEQNKLDKAVICYHQAIQIAPNLSQAHHNLGEILSSQKDWEGAIAAYRQAIQADPNNPESTGSANGMGRALVKQGKHEEAVAAYREAIRLDPKQARAHYNLGKSLAHLADWNEAVSAYREAISLQPDLPYIQSDLGEALRQRANRDLQDALGYYRQAIQENPADLQNYHKALDITPNDVELYVGLANALVRKGNTDGAIVFYQMALQLQPNNMDISSKLDRVLKKKSNSNLRIKADELIAERLKAVNSKTLSTQIVNKNAQISRGFSQVDRSQMISSGSLSKPELTTNDIRLIAFYLPQYHPIPENDAWWGKGFTEWTNVARAMPLFEGHYQPQLPADLGFYDLRLSEVREAQASLAKQYGVHGFCYYYYWFAGKRLLERPLDDLLKSKKPDFPFCICWANENWTRRWDGAEHEILMAQECWKDDQNQAFAESVVPILLDERYIRINGAPLLIVYRYDLFPDPLHTTDLWRKIFWEKGVGEVHLCVAITFGGLHTDPSNLGFDSAVQFPPHGFAAREISPLEVDAKDFSGKLYDYRDGAINSVSTKLPDSKVFLSVMTAWDNTARRKGAAHAFIGSTPDIYEFWLRGAIEKTQQMHSGDEQIVFVNAWNEWAEGAHLEPDQKNGHSYLAATRRALCGTHNWQTIIDLIRHLPISSADQIEQMLDELIRRIKAKDRTIEAMDAMIKQKIAKVTGMSRYHNETASLWQLDEPRVGSIVNVSHVLIAGWVLIEKSPAVTIEIVCNGLVLQQTPVNIHRSDVAEVHPSLGADHSGFSTTVVVTDTTSNVELHIRAILEDGSYVLMEEIQLQPGYDIVHHLGTNSEYGDRIENIPASSWESIIDSILFLPIANISDRHQLLSKLEQIVAMKERLLEAMEKLLRQRPVHEFFQQDVSYE